MLKQNKLDNRGKLNLSYKIIKGYPVEDVVVNFARHNDVSLIIMGTKGATGLKKKLIGSNATAVINSSEVPVITVPEPARFNKLKHIVYATDMTNINAEMKKPVPLAKLFDATVHISHIVSPGSKKKIDPKKIVTGLVLQMKYPKITFHISMNEDILEGIDEYIVDKKADILAMFTHDVTFFERLFGKSVTHEMAFSKWASIIDN